ncbi:MAG: SIS domain-containing protein [Bacteroidetes bacterium]|nr:SIS domain-containing protein [Bacteroidota bacterium]
MIKIGRFEGAIQHFMEEYYIPGVVEGLRTIDDQILEDVSEKVVHRIREGRRIFGFGNGGSEAISEAFIYALEQRINDEFEFDTYSNPKLGEAVDTKNGKLFNHRIRRSGREGDLVVLVSASGNSENINNVSALCKEKGVETVSVSGGGRIANDPKTTADNPVVIMIKDQQILEDVTLGLVYLVAELAQYKTGGVSYDTGEVKRRYIEKLADGLGQLAASRISHLALEITRAYKEGKRIRIDAPDSGQLSINAKHMQHNLKWDAFQDAKRLTNRVYSGLPTYHMSGVSNDGGDGLAYAVEVDDNSEPGDVSVVFAKDMNSMPVQALLKAAERKGIPVDAFCFHVDSEYVASSLTQSVLHLTSRAINAYLLTEQGDPREFSELLGGDLALLRQKNETRKKLGDTYT